VNLLRFLYRHEDQMDQLRLHAPPDDLLFDLVDDPRAVELEVVPGPMGRLVDVVTGLEALPAPAGVDGSVALSVEDPLADWNDGEFGIEVADGAITVEPGTATGPAATLPVETLSRLALGNTTVERAAVAGGLDADDDARSQLAALFPPRETFLREFF
jgi:predicted acetyltransferase